MPVENERILGCHRYEGSVVISLGATDGSEVLYLNTREAQILADKLRHELSSAQMARDLGFPARSEFDLCDMMPSATEAGCLLDRLMSVIGEVQPASDLHNRTNWRRGGF